MERGQDNTIRVRDGRLSFLPIKALKPPTASSQVVIKKVLDSLRTVRLPSTVSLENMLRTWRRESLLMFLESIGVLALVKTLKDMPELLKKVLEVVRKALRKVPELLWNFILQMILKELKAFIIKIGIVSAIGITFGYLIYQLRKEHHALAIGEGILGDVLLIVADDVLQNHTSRTSFRKLLSYNGFQAVIPLCVMEDLQKRMQTPGADCHQALASFLSIMDLVKSAPVRLQREMGQGDVAGCHLPYEDRMVNTALVFGHLNMEATVFLMTNSDGLRAKARERAVRSATPTMLLRMIGV